MAATAATCNRTGRIRLGSSTTWAEQGRKQTLIGLERLPVGLHQVTAAQAMEDRHRDREGRDHDRSGAEDAKSKIVGGFEADDVDDQNSKEEDRAEGSDSGPFELSRNSRQRDEAGMRGCGGQNANRSCDLPVVLLVGFGPDAKDEQERGSDGEHDACSRQKLCVFTLPQRSRREGADARGGNGEGGHDDSDFKLAEVTGENSQNSQCGADAD